MRSISHRLQTFPKDVEIKIITPEITHWVKESVATLIAAHGYGRNGNFYAPILEESINSHGYNQAIHFNFPWHDWWKNEISFDMSIELLHAVLQETENLFWKNNILWGHSYGAFIASFLASRLWNQIPVLHMVLSSLPFAMNNQFLTKLARNTIGNRSHEEMLDWKPVKARNEKLWVEWKMIFWDLTIQNWPYYVDEFWSMPSLLELKEGSISTPTTLVRARVDAILNIYARKVANGIHCIWKSAETQWFQTLHRIFSTAEYEVIPWAWHGIKVPKTHNSNAEKWPQQVKSLLKILESTREKYENM